MRIGWFEHSYGSAPFEHFPYLSSLILHRNNELDFKSMPNLTELEPSELVNRLRVRNSLRHCSPVLTTASRVWNDYSSGNWSTAAISLAGGKRWGLRLWCYRKSIKKNQMGTFRACGTLTLTPSVLSWEQIATLQSCRMIHINCSTRYLCYGI